MNTAELKINLINQITNITDKVKLKEVLQLLNFQSDNALYITNDEEKEAVLAAKKQIEENEVYSNEDVQEEIQKWLKK